jgi:hypothetical protein
MHCDGRHAVVAGPAFTKGKNGKPSHKDKNGYDPGGYHLTDRLARARRPALSADAMLHHDPRLNLVLGAGDAENCHHVSLRSVQAADDFTIACSHRGTQRSPRLSLCVARQVLREVLAIGP